MKLIIGIVLLCAAFVQSQIVCDETKFKCDSANPKLITLIIENKEYKLECKEENEVCNSKYKIDTTCNPCIVPSDTCDDAFVCPDGQSQNINVNGFPMLCPENKVCNAKYEDNCELCIPIKCSDAEKYECPDNDPDHYILNNEIVNCRPGYTCNSDYFEPCQKCISKTRQRLLRLGFVV